MILKMKILKCEVLEGVISLTSMNVLKFIYLRSQLKSQDKEDNLHTHIDT